MSVRPLNFYLSNAGTGKNGKVYFEEINEQMKGKGRKDKIKDHCGQLYAIFS